MCITTINSRVFSNTRDTIRAKDTIRANNLLLNYKGLSL